MTLQEKLDAMQARADKSDKTHMAHNYHAAVITVPLLIKALNWLRSEHWKQIERSTECRGVADINLETIDMHLLAILEGEDE